jgi:hypothetical protein
LRDGGGVGQADVWAVRGLADARGRDGALPWAGAVLAGGAAATAGVSGLAEGRGDGDGDGAAGAADEETGIAGRGAAAAARVAAA